MTSCAQYDCSGLSDIGRARPENEDQFLIADLRTSLDIQSTSLPGEEHHLVFGGATGQLLMVADGMGGHAAGREAAAIAVNTVVDHILHNTHWCDLLSADDSEMMKVLESALSECGDRVHAEADRRPAQQGMGTTLTVAYIRWPKLHVVHVGDSRCYLLRESKLKQLTTDHTLAEKMLAGGTLTVQQAAHTRLRHVLWNSIGGNSRGFKPDFHSVRLEPHDQIMLCTDGLTGHVSDARIAEVLAQQATSEGACRQLIDEANEAGGKDNITIVVARCDEPPESSSCG